MRIENILVLTALIWAAGCNLRHETNVEAATPAPPAQPSDPNQVAFAPGSPQLQRIRTEAISTAEVPVDEVASPGRVEANANRLSHVVLPLGGRVTAVMVKIGDFVTQGQPVLAVESPDVDQAQSSYLQSESAIIQAKSALVKAQADFDRSKDLFEHGALAQKEVLNAQAVLAQSKSALDQAMTVSEQARRRLGLLGVNPGQFGQKILVHAPISGKVLELAVAAGEFRNDLAASLMTIADLSTVWVTSDVPESSIRLVRMNEPIVVEFEAYPGEKFRGHVAQIADTLDPTTRTIKVRSVLDNSQGRFRPDMFARIRLDAATATKPVVPAAAIVSEADQTVVWKKVAPGTFRRTPVTLGARAGDRFAVLTGVETGEQVVTGGVMLLKSI